MYVYQAPCPPYHYSETVCQLSYYTSKPFVLRAWKDGGTCPKKLLGTSYTSSSLSALVQRVFSVQVQTFFFAAAFFRNCESWLFSFGYVAEYALMPERVSIFEIILRKDVRISSPTPHIGSDRRPRLFSAILSPLRYSFRHVRHVRKNSDSFFPATLRNTFPMPEESVNFPTFSGHSSPTHISYRIHALGLYRRLVHLSICPLES